MSKPPFYLVKFITVVGKYYIKQSRDGWFERTVINLCSVLLKTEECIASGKGKHLLFQERYGFLLAKV